jgi:RimJ/RimL family protein N-acetyltransferase
MKVEIRPLQESDAATSVHWRNDPEIWRHTESAPDRHITLEDELAWVRRVTADPESRRFAILADGTYIGNIYLTGLSGGEADYHIFIGDKSYWGKGIAREASEQIIAYGRDELGLNAVNLKVKRSNEGAYRLYRKLGFEEHSTKGDFITMTLKLRQDHR